MAGMQAGVDVAGDLAGLFAPDRVAVLGRAEEAGMPVIAVNADTLSTVERAEEVVRGGRTRDEETVRVMRDLLADHVDVDALVGGD